MSLPALGHSLQLPNNELVEEVDDFKYLGSMMNSCQSDLKIRRGLAWTSFWQMKSIWHSKTLPVKLKLRIFQSTCLSIFLYGCEAWPITSAMASLINSYATSCYRFILNIKRLGKISNTVILSTVGKDNLMQTVIQRQLRWLGHTLRLPNSSVVNQYALYQPLHGKRKRGRPRLHYKGYIEKLTHLTAHELRETAADRDVWRRLVDDCSIDGAAGR